MSLMVWLRAICSLLATIHGLTIQAKPESAINQHVSLVTLAGLAAGVTGRPASDRHPLAQAEFPTVLALEISLLWRPTHPGQ